MSETTDTTPAQVYQNTLDAVMAKLPAGQRPAASALINIYGPKLLTLAAADISKYIKRLLAGDVAVPQEILQQCSDEEFLRQVSANTTAWEQVENYNVVRKDMAKTFMIQAAPILLKILLALVGL